MLELYVLRHAKSAWNDPALADHDRPLAPRGVKAAAWMGRLMAERGWLAQRILCSSAARTRATLDGLRAQWPKTSEPEVSIEPGLYMAEPRRILEIIRERGGPARRLLLIGHNPGLQAFVPRLVGTGDAALLAAIEGKFPTAALARVVLDLKSWEALAWGLGHLTDYERPERRC